MGGLPMICHQSFGFGFRGIRFGRFSRLRFRISRVIRIGIILTVTLGFVRIRILNTNVSGFPK
eukprot:12428081-Karenia_brevis.AAC.1